MVATREVGVVGFRGEVLSVAQLLDASRAAPALMPGSSVGIRHTAAQNAAACRGLLAEGMTLDACWRFGILQTLDDYTSALRREVLVSRLRCSPTSRLGLALRRSTPRSLRSPTISRDVTDGPHRPGRVTPHAARLPGIPRCRRSFARRRNGRAPRRSGGAESSSRLVRWREHERRRAARRKQGACPVSGVVRAARER